MKLDWQSGEEKIAISQPTAKIEAAEGIFEGELARFGHGLQRSFIFALLEEQAEGIAKCSNPAMHSQSVLCDWQNV